MSHTVQVKSTQMTDFDCIIRATQRLNLARPTEGRHKMFDDQVIDGLSLQLPDWREPVVIDRAGKVYYDNYRGEWGNQIELDRLIQAYTLERSASELTAMGYTSLTEVPLENGDVKLEAVCYA